MQMIPMNPAKATTRLLCLPLNPVPPFFHPLVINPSRLKKLSTAKATVPLATVSQKAVERTMPSAMRMRGREKMRVERRVRRTWKDKSVMAKKVQKRWKKIEDSGSQAECETAERALRGSPDGSQPDARA